MTRNEDIYAFEREQSISSLSPPSDDKKRKVQALPKNLYTEHPLMIDSGTFWRCDHGSTGWYACVPCGKQFPEEFVKHVQSLKQHQSEQITDRFIFE